MEEKDVIEFFNKLPNRIPLKFTNDEFVKRYDDANEIMRKALEKQISQIATETQEIAIIEYICPVCNQLNGRFNYCYNCGQKLYIGGEINNVD